MTAHLILAIAAAALVLAIGTAAVRQLLQQARRRHVRTAVAKACAERAETAQAISGRVSRFAVEEAALAALRAPTQMLPATIAYQPTHDVTGPRHAFPDGHEQLLRHVLTVDEAIAEAEKRAEQAGLVTR